MFYYFDCSKLPTITSFYSVTRNTVWQISENTHILLYISSGTCSITMDSTDYLLEKGDVFYIPADHSYTRRSIDNTMCTMTYVHFLLPSATREENACALAKEMQNQRKVLEEKTLSGEQNPQHRRRVPEKQPQIPRLASAAGEGGQGQHRRAAAPCPAEVQRQTAEYRRRQGHG